jgi:hypothetical protein
VKIVPILCAQNGSVAQGAFGTSSSSIETDLKSARPSSLGPLFAIPRNKKNLAKATSDLGASSLAQF